MYEGIGLLVMELTRSTLKFTQRKLGERILVEKRMGGRVYLSFPLLWCGARSTLMGSTKRIITRPPASDPAFLGIPVTIVKPFP